MRCAVAFALWLASASTWGACDPLPGGGWRSDCARLTWTYPTRNVDGSALVDLADFRVFRRCDAAPLAVLATVPASTSAPNGGESSGYIDAAPAGETCWYSVTARNAGGEESARTGEVSKTFAADLPGDVSASFTWQILDEPDPPNVAAPTVTGQEIGSTSDPLTATLSVPSGATSVVVMIAYYPDRTTTVTLGGVSPDYSYVVPNNDSMAAYVWNDPATGDQSLSIDFSGSLGAGAVGYAYFVEGAEPFGGASYKDQDAYSGTGAISSTVSGIAADWLALRFESRYSPGSAPALESGWTSLGTASTGSLHHRASYKVSTGTSVTATTESNAYPTLQVLAFEPLASGVGATVNRAAETDTAQAIARSKSQAIGQAAESDFAQAVARYKARVAALAAETDTAQAIGKAKARTAGQAAESDTSRTITPAGAPVGGTVTQALETDSARTLSSSKAKAIGQAAELDLVQTILRVKARAVGQALEGDSARPISLPGSIGGTLSQAIESDLARSVGKAKAKAIAQALETDAGRAIAAMRAYAVGRASETDAAIAVAAIGKALALGVATEQDIARAFTVSGGAPVDFYYLREALEMAAASIIAALANTTVTVDVGGAGETSGVVAIQQERSFDPGLPGLRMASTSTEFLLEKKTAPASLKQGTLIRDETSSETYRVRRLNYNRGGIVTVEIERV